MVDIDEGDFIIINLEHYQYWIKKVLGAKRLAFYVTSHVKLVHFAITVT